MQDAATLALFVADGTLDVVDDKDFEKAKPHAIDHPGAQRRADPDQAGSTRDPRV